MRRDHIRYSIVQRSINLYFMSRLLQYAPDKRQPRVTFLFSDFRGPMSQTLIQLE